MKIKNIIFGILLFITLKISIVTAAETYGCLYVTTDYGEANEIDLIYNIEKNGATVKLTLPFDVSDFVIDPYAYWYHENTFPSKYIKLIKEGSECPTITVKKDYATNRIQIHAGKLEEPLCANLSCKFIYGARTEVTEDTETSTTVTQSNTNIQIEPTTNNNSNSPSLFNAQYVQCGGINGIPSGLPKFSRSVVNVIKFFIPIILIIMGFLDFGKAVMANDEKAMSEGPKKFLKRIISAILIFFVVAIVQFIFNILGKSDSQGTYVDSGNLSDCLKCFISDESGCSADTVTGTNTNNANTN